MAITLPNESLQEIFSYIQYDKKALHNCLFVNRNWCCNIIPLLWKQPFHFWKDTNEPSPKLTEVYLNFLSNKSRNRLSVKPYLTLPKPTKPPIFHYPIYLQNLDTEKLYLASRRWLENIEQFLEDLDYKEYSRALAHELGILFMEQCKKIIRLEIHHELVIVDYDAEKYWSEERYALLNDNTYTSLPLFIGAKNCLRDLCEFECHRQRKAGVLLKMAEYCHHIEKLEVSMYNCDELACDVEAEAIGLTYLMLSQQGLKKFVLSGNKYEWPDVAKSFSSQSKTLTCVDFCDLDFDLICDPLLESIALLNSLEKLTFRYCSPFTKQNMTSLCEASFPYLQTLRFFCSHPPLESLVQLINNVKNTMIYLAIAPEISENYVEHVNTLMYLPLVEACSRIKVLELSRYFSPESLEYFLKNSRAPIEILHLGRCWKLNAVHLDVVSEYAKSSNLKLLNLRFVSKKLPQKRIKHLQSLIEEVITEDSPLKIKRLL
ncbi:21139_t:CDS:2 [Gigaspora margarita]|uniref:21139_t:CDS:1 n=1 Tax=Gigaspora margarita TaxID=4874 RepID=A0ABN7V416_GIGMA|nr:21139_t:CDS:2 [Gigaspora margarita]